MLVAGKGQDACPVFVTPAVLQSVIARPLVAVQTSLLMDTVAWQRGVLATPPVSCLLHSSAASGFVHASFKPQ
jgi:hypothetical protein